MIDELDEDLANVEEDIYNRKKMGCSGKCNGEDERILGENFVKDGKYEVTCSNCGRIVELNDEIFEKEDIVCPECGSKIDFDFREKE